MKINNWLAWLIVIALVFFLAGRAMGAEATISWQPNSENDLAGYKVYYGTASGSYETPFDAGNVMTFTIGNLQEGTMYYFAVTAYDTSNNESGFSNEVSKLWADITAPDSPKQLIIIIQ